MIVIVGGGRASSPILGENGKKRREGEEKEEKRGKRYEGKRVRSIYFQVKIRIKHTNIYLLYDL